MKQTSVLILLAVAAVTTNSLDAQFEPPPPAAAEAVPVEAEIPETAPVEPFEPATAVAPAGFEVPPTLNASAILQPQYLQGENFTVQNPVPTYGGANQYTINSTYGVFQADGNQMLMRRVAEINGITQLMAISQSNEFGKAAAKAAEAPLNVAQDLVTNPVSTISNVPKGIWGFLNRTGQSLKEAAEGRRSGANQGNVVENMTGFSKTKRDLALKLGVDPYCNNEVFQKELNKVAWPAFLGTFTVRLGMAAVTGGAGAALSAANWTNSLTSALRDKSPTDLRLMNLGILMNDMGVARSDADAFLNNNAISPTTQTIIVGALQQLGNIPGQAVFIQRAATSQDERDALSYQLSIQLMAKINENAPVARISHLNGLTVCQTNDGTLIVPIQWDYAAWTPMTEKFITALKAEKLEKPATAYTIMITGDASPMAAQQLAAREVNLVTKGLPGPLQ